MRSNKDIIHYINDNYCKKCMLHKPNQRNDCSIFSAIISPVLSGKKENPFTDQIVRKQLLNGCKSYKEK